MALNTLYLVRHGENRANITKEFSYKKVDYPLTPRGVLQAEQTAGFLKEKEVEEIYSSPLKRALETAEIAGRATGAPVSMVEEFRDLNVGVLEDGPPSAEDWRLFIRINNDWYSDKPTSRFPGGEDYFTFQRRVQEGLEGVLRGKSGRRIAIVAHAGVILTAVELLCPEADPAALHWQSCNNGSVTAVEAEMRERRFEGRLVEWASCVHLSGEAASLVPGAPEEKA